MVVPLPAPDAPDVDGWVRTPRWRVDTIVKWYQQHLERSRSAGARPHARRSAQSRGNAKPQDSKRVTNQSHQSHQAARPVGFRTAEDVVAEVPPAIFSHAA